MLFRVKSEPVFSIRMATVTVRKKTRRGRRKGNRFSSSKRSVFIPARNWLEKGDRSKINFAAENITSGGCPISDQIENSAPYDGCEFFYSHWWNCTPFKKTQKLVRPPYMPIAPNNSTQFIIDSHFEIEFDKTGRDEVEESIVTDNYGDSESEKNEHSGGVQHSAVSEDLSRNSQRMELKPCTNRTDIADRCQQHNETPEDNLKEGDVEGSYLLEIDYDYESLYNDDFFEFVHNDFVQTYQELQREKLLRLPKSELIVKIMELETKFDELQRKEEMQNLT